MKNAATDEHGKSRMQLEYGLVVEMDEEKEELEEEHATYTLTSLLGDIGGTAGLFLGLSLVGIDFEYY